MNLRWDMHSDRRGAFYQSKKNQRIFHDWAKELTDEQSLSLGFYRSESTTLKIGKRKGKLSPFEVHSVRPVRRVGPDGQQQTELVAEITQSWIPSDNSAEFYRGGSTIIIGLEDACIRYCIRKRVGRQESIEAQQSFRMSTDDDSLRSNYSVDPSDNREPFAMLHRGL